MDFLLEYRDPLFGLLLFFGLVFIIAFFSYWWALLRLKKEDNWLERFFERFEGMGDKEIEKLLSDSQNTLLLLAEAFMSKGEYEKAIALYLRLKSESDFHTRLLLLEKLGDLYAKSGFLERAIQSYEEILRYLPRRAELLRKLLLLFEKMNDWERIEEVVEILEELEAFGEERNYFAIKKAVVFGDIEEVVRLKKEFRRIALEYLFRVDIDRAWQLLEPEDILAVVDILWRLPQESIRTDKRLLQELYSAKGYVALAKRSEIFEFDLLLHYPKGDLDFEYLCSECKNIFPFAFHRCPKCFSIKEPIVEMVITKKRGVDEESISI